MGKTSNALAEEYQKLKAVVSDHDFRYWVENEPTIPDAEYDALFRELRVMEEVIGTTNPDWLIGSPTQRIGSKIAAFRQHQHATKMMSLDNALNKEELVAFMESLSDKSPEWVAELKIDGLAVSIIYENGMYSRATTRGDGDSGEDVTANVRTIRSVPMVIDTPLDRVEVRGEVYMPSSMLERLNMQMEEASEKLYVSSRNAASGSLRQLDPYVTSTRNLSFLAYDVLSDNVVFRTERDKLAWLWRAKVPIVPFRDAWTMTDGVIQYIDGITEMRHTLDYDIDGIVFKVNQVELQREIGNTSHHPKWAIAYKFPPEKAVTTLTDVEWSIGKTGTLTPVGLVTPVVVGGVTISRVNLSNMAKVNRLGLGIGDKITIHRSGDVIPDVTGVAEHAKTFMPIVPPHACPACGSKVVKPEGKETYSCTGGYKCYAQVKRLIAHFVSRDAMDIEGLGPAIIDNLVDHGVVSDPSDIYRLTTEDLLGVGVGPAVSVKIIEAIESSRNTTLQRFLYALSITSTGKGTSLRLAKTYGNLPAVATATVESLRSIKDIELTTATAITEWFAVKTNNDLVNELYGFITIAPPSDVMMIPAAITGRFDHSRSDIVERLHELGVLVGESVTKKTAFLLAGLGATQGKVDKAEKLKIPVYTDLSNITLPNGTTIGIF